MVKYICEKCEKEFILKSHYTKHTNIKNSCIFKNKIEEITDNKIEETTEIVKQEEEYKIINYIDLCSGIGGFRIALEKFQNNNSNYKFNCVLSADIKDDAIKTYNLNFNENNKKINILDLEEIPNFDLLCMGFPCFIAGTLTLTNTGYKNIENVELTDKLLTHTGKFQNILNLQTKIYNGFLYEIRVKYHPTIISCTEEHPFYIREKKKLWNNELRKYEYIFEKPIWKKANELTINDFFGMPININEIIPEFIFNKSINKFNTTEVNIKLDKLDYWFMIGYFIGDGWIEETTKKDGRCMHKIRFAINNKDEAEVFERINRVIPITDKKCNIGKCKKFGCSNFIWYNILKQFGKYAHGKLIPEWVHNAPKEFIQEFINGYMKADGYINKNRILQITTVSYNLAFGVQRLYLKLGYIFSITKFICPKTTIIEGRIVNQRDCYMVRGILQKKRIILSFIEDNYIWYAPFKITKKEVKETIVYNFEVENDNSYIVENICVHNCQPFSSAGNKKGFDDDRGKIIFKVIDICKKYKPKIIILENVSNLIILENGIPFKKICDEFTKINYFVSYKKLNSIDFGVPQNRERIFIVCSLEKMINMDNIKYINQNNKLNSIIDNTAKYTDIEINFANKILDLHIQTPLFGYKMQDKRGGKNNIHSWDIYVNGILTINERNLMNKIMTERRKKHWADKKNIIWMDGMPLTFNEITTFIDDANLKQMLDNLVIKKYLRLEKPKNLISGKRVYDEQGEIGYNICKGKLSFPITNILDPSSTSPTLTATDSNKLAVIIDNKFIRKLNNNELKLLCGFPLSYKLPNDINKYDLFGNMVIPNVVEGILKCIY